MAGGSLPLERLVHGSVGTVEVDQSDVVSLDHGVADLHTFPSQHPGEPLEAGDLERRDEPVGARNRRLDRVKDRQVRLRTAHLELDEVLPLLFEVQREAERLAKEYLHLLVIRHPCLDPLQPLDEAAPRRHGSPAPPQPHMNVVSTSRSSLGPREFASRTRRAGPRDPRGIPTWRGPNPLGAPRGTPWPSRPKGRALGGRAVPPET